MIFSASEDDNKKNDTSDETEEDRVVATVQCYGDKMVLSLTERRNVESYHLFDSGVLIFSVLGSNV